MQIEHIEGIVLYALLQSKRMFFFVVSHDLLIILISLLEVSFQIKEVVAGLFNLGETLRTSFHPQLTGSHQSDSQQFSPFPFGFQNSLR